MFKKISDTIRGKYARKDELSRHLLIVRVFDIFKKETAEIFGEDVGAQPATLRNKILRVKTNSSVLANELRFHDQKILEKINSALGSQVVEKIIYRF
jgi:hypothetical protein